MIFLKQMFLFKLKYTHMLSHIIGHLHELTRQIILTVTETARNKAKFAYFTRSIKMLQPFSTGKLTEVFTMFCNDLTPFSNLYVHIELENPLSLGRKSSLLSC